MNVSLDTLKEAVSIKENIAKLEVRLHKILAYDGDNPWFIALQSKTAIKKGRRKMSKAARALIAAAQKARWAKVKGTVVAAEKAVVKSVVVAEKAVVKSVKKGISAAGRARIAAAQKLRWSKVKKAAPTPAVVKAAKKGKRRLSAAGRAKIIAAQKKRWAAKKK